MKQIGMNNLTVIGNAYVYDMMSYILQDGEDRYTCKYCVQVE